jgi:hypothetical protein
MKGWRRLFALALLGGAAGVLLAACGSSGPQYPNINFVGNASCPTASASPYDPKPPAVNGDKIVGTAIDEMPHVHVGAGTHVDYNHDPPTSGCHYSQNTPDPAPVLAGSYDKEIPAEYWVHNLEHGYVVVLYNCPTGCSAEFSQLHTWQKGLPPDPAGGGKIPYAKAVVLPWHTMKDHFAVVSWDYYLGLSTLDMTQIQAFYDNHVGHSPEGALTG